MSKTRVVVVDDSALVRSLLGEIINRQPDMECVGAASDPYVAREMIRTLDPDVITLDVEMPRMDGIDFLGKLMRLRPMPVVMVSTLTERGAEVTLRALELGAVDFVAKPKIGVSDGLRQLADDITDKIRVATRILSVMSSASWRSPSDTPIFGFATKSTAPSSSARSVTSAPRSVSVETITTGIGRSRISLPRKSMPSIRGISTSSVITSGSRVRIISRAT